MRPMSRKVKRARRRQAATTKKINQSIKRQNDAWSDFNKLNRFEEVTHVTKHANQSPNC